MITDGQPRDAGPGKDQLPQRLYGVVLPRGIGAPEHNLPPRNTKRITFGLLRNRGAGQQPGDVGPVSGPEKDGHRRTVFDTDTVFLQNADQQFRSFRISVVRGDEPNPPV
ncbi:hypothetical protein GCM10009828_100330 [Actinoplanes couchii]|uniref:Uncharacterized protein n=1 Tax=Actinoplanes couchii TaxID=403638 RepID=A0ABQ3XM42_9ACTN|nr:hypothetical protein Aco03nite_079570 [Actinoplanes couchii]